MPEDNKKPVQNKSQSDAGEKQKKPVSYKVLENFKGSPNGAIVISYKKGESVDHADLGDDLAETARAEKWIKKS